MPAVSPRQALWLGGLLKHDIHVETRKSVLSRAEMCGTRGDLQNRAAPECSFSGLLGYSPPSGPTLPG